MNDYTPTTEALRDAWRRDRVWAFGAPAVNQRGAAEAGFDAWLAEVIATVQTEGRRAGKAEAVKRLVDLVHDENRGLAFDDDHDRAAVAAWIEEAADV